MAPRRRLKSNALKLEKTKKRREMAAEEKRERSHSWELMPRELRNEILLRLPVKSLIRFKAVCKAWYSLISDPDFAISHFELGARRTDRLVSLSGILSDSEFRDLNGLLYDTSKSAIAKLNLNSLPSEPCRIIVLGSCRGFLVLRLTFLTKYHPTQYICNPSTGLCKVIDPSPNSFTCSHISFDCTTLSLFIRGFGYDASTDDYLFVQSFHLRGHRERVPYVEYFSLRANEWDEIEFTSYPHFHYKPFNIHKPQEIGLFFKGAIHWVASCYDDPKHVILAFDLEERSFSEIPMPINFGYCYYKNCGLRELGDLLCLFAVRCDSMPTEIWVMKEYKEQSSWTRAIDVSVGDFNLPTQSFFPIYSTKGDGIFYDNVITALVKGNDKGQVQESRTYAKCLSDPRRMALYTESLLSLPCESQQANVENQQ